MFNQSGLADIKYEDVSLLLPSALQWHPDVFTQKMSMGWDLASTARVVVLPPPSGQPRSRELDIASQAETEHVVFTTDHA